MNFRGRQMTINCNNPLLYFFLKIFFSAVVVVFSDSANLFAQGALRVTAQEQHVENVQSFSVMWVILGIWFVVSLYLVYIDRKISSLEKKHKK